MFILSYNYVYMKQRYNLGKYYFHLCLEGSADPTGDMIEMFLHEYESVIYLLLVI